MAKSAKLLLFDIDGTLLHAGGAGAGALTQAFLEVFAAPLAGRTMPELNLAGTTDSGVLRDLFAHFGFQPNAGEVPRFYERYLALLESNLTLQDPSGSGRLPGALEFLLHLREHHPQHRLNLLTGNIQTGAWLKVRHYGFDGFFTTGAFGDDHPDRNSLCPIAVAREHAASGRHFSPEEIVVIGDTPRDIACGKAYGAHTLAIATGQYSAAALAQHQPTQLRADWSNPAALADCLTEL